MGKIYKGQTKLLINVNLGVDVTGCTVQLKYRKPNGTEGAFNANIITEATGDVQFEVTTPSQLDVVGTWTFWGYITYADGKVAAGEPFSIELFSEGR